MQAAVSEGRVRLRGLCFGGLSSGRVLILRLAGGGLGCCLFERLIELGWGCLRG